MISRRALLAVSMIAAAPAKPLLVLQQGDSVQREESVTLPGGGVFIVPRLRARLVAVLKLRVMDVTCVAFGADGPGVEQDLVAFIAQDGVLLALECLHWRAASGRELATRLAMLPDRRHVTLERSFVEPGVAPRHESWTDYLVPEDDMLTNAPPRPVLPGTWQATLSVHRAAISSAISPHCHAITAELRAAYNQNWTTTG